ncbi:MULTISPECIES: methyltransferase [Paenibacillus]|uniref:methyltransferase n=1 Tax=Paenibacillus TaxID=44249 RepID=UPI0022B8E062|nr:methyltransferase [Paenibacillus caseinilyticus]MCZ8523067.1 methyltransferase [Paenibacillus caseinilyticus]
MTTIGIDKGRVRRHFDRHAHEYDRYAAVQRHMAEELQAGLCERRNGQEVRRIVEIGCGTGLLTAMLLDAYPYADVTSIDISPKMAEATRLRCMSEAERRLTVLTADAESILLEAEWAQERFADIDLLVSSAAFQWFNDTRQTLNLWLGRMSAAGLLAFATFGPDTFNELHSAFRIAEQELGIEPQSSGQHFMSQEEWEGLLYSYDKFPWEVDCREELVLQRFDSVLSFLDSIKRVGAGNAVQDGREGFPSARQRMKKMIEAYTQVYGSNDGIPATYQLYYTFYGKG